MLAFCDCLSQGRKSFQHRSSQQRTKACWHLMENKALGNMPNNCSLLWRVQLGAAYSFAPGKAAAQQGGSRYFWRFECWFFLHKGITDELKVWILRSVCSREWGWGLGEHQHENKRKTVRFRAVPCSGHSCVEWALQVLLSVPALWHAASFHCFWIKTETESYCDGCVKTTVWWIKQWWSRIMWFGEMSDWCCL